MALICGPKQLTHACLPRRGVPQPCEVAFCDMCSKGIEVVRGRSNLDKVTKQLGIYRTKRPFHLGLLALFFYLNNLNNLGKVSS